jgi:hypothetical protein
MGKYLDLAKGTEGELPRITAYLPRELPRNPKKGENVVETKTYVSPKINTAFNAYICARAGEGPKAASTATPLRGYAKNAVIQKPEDFRHVPGELNARGNYAVIPGAHSAPDIPATETLPPEWWRDEFEERAAIRQYDGHYTRADAERLAWGELQCRWHKEHGERVPADICAGCYRQIGSRPALDVADGNRVHDHTDHACLIEFGKRWRGAATRALIEMGLTPPAPDPDEVR